MARTVIPVNPIVVSGLVDPVEVDGDAANDHEFTNDERNLTFLRLNNTDSGARTVVIETSGELESDLPYPNREIELAAGEVQFVGPFLNDLYNQDETEDLVYVNVDTNLVKLTAFLLEG